MRAIVSFSLIGAALAGIALIPLPYYVAATFEVIYGHAWKPAPRTVADGRQIMRFDLRRRDREPG